MAGEKRDKTPRRKREERKPGDAEQAQDQPQSADEQPVEREAPRAEPEPVETRDRAPCPVVGVGASAGGLEALQGLFAHVPAEPRLAFVVVQHRASDRTSMMKSLLEKHTQLRVKDIVDAMKVEPDAIYLAPADQDVSIMNGALYLIEPAPHGGAHLPIDSFLRTLARAEAKRAICILLSGTGSDGTLGLKEIKASGGTVMAQKEDRAQYDSMPRSAIETGMVDFVLPVEKMGERLLHYVKHPFLERRKAPEMDEKAEDQFQKVFMLIRNITGHDFSHYKRNTVQRRIARRLAVHQLADLGAYIRMLQENSDEVNALAKEMLITVTDFFRDREAFEILAERVIGPLAEQKPPNVPLRVWVPGCATGKEAYSVAILLQEQIAKNARHHQVQVFATDLDDDSLNIARRGVYSKSIAADVSPARLQRFFSEEGSSYKIKNGIRATLVFAKHNLIKDAPFSKLDLVCCRNVLIYMDSNLQKKLIPMFHYTLNPGGHLFLGESESIGAFADLFAPVESKHKIFKRKPARADHEPER